MTTGKTRVMTYGKTMAYFENCLSNDDLIKTLHGSKIFKSTVEFLNEKHFTIKDINKTYRVINNWSKLGVIDEDRSSEKEWRKFSYVDLLWLEIIEKLRNFGFPLEKIRDSKASLFRKKCYIHGREDLEKFTFFDFFLVQALLLKRQTHVIVDINGSAGIYTREDIEFSDIFWDSDDYININLSRILVEKVSPSFTPEDRKIIRQLKEEEKELLGAIYSNQFSEIKASIDNKKSKITELETTKIHQLDKRMVELLKDADHQEITFKQKRGRTSHIEQKVKKQFSE